MLANKQITSLAIVALTGKILLSYPRMLIELIGSSAWISLFIYTGVGFGLFAATSAIYKSGDTIIKTANDIGGKWLRIATGIFTFIVIFANIITIFREFPDIIRLVLLQKTYSEFIVTAFYITVAIGAFCGVEAVGRVSSIFLPVCGAVFVAFLIMLIPSYDIENISPIFGNGAAATLGKGVSSLSVFSDLILINMLLPHIKRKCDYKKCGLKAVLISGICCTLIVLAYSLCYPYPSSVDFLIPVYQLERFVNLSSFFSRFEAVLQMFWTIILLLYAVLNVSVLSEVLQSTFGTKNEKIYIIPITAMIAAVTMTPWMKYNVHYIGYYIMKVIYIPAFLLPIVYGLFHVKHSDKRNKERHQ